MERKIIVQGSLEEFKNDGDNFDRYYLPARGLVIPGDNHVLPETLELQTYTQQLNQILTNLALNPRKIIFIPDSDYLLDIAIMQHISLVKEKLQRGVNYQVYPYAVTTKTLEWIEGLKAQGFNIKPAFPQKLYFENLTHPAHRGGWGRWVNKPDISSFPERHNLPYPVAWIGFGLAEIIEAYKRVVYYSQNNEAFFKPIFSAGGFTLRKITSEEDLISHYQRLKERGALDFNGQEIPVEIQAFIPDITGLYSLQYTENGQLFTPRGLSKQIVTQNQWQGNIFNGETGDDALLTIWERFHAGYQKEWGINFGWGGIDLAKRKSGEWIILEHNGLRITGAHPAIFLAQQFNTLHYPFATLKSPGEVNSDLITLWELLERNNLAFDLQLRTGIFPIVWFPGSGMLWATGEQPLKLLETAYNILSKQGLII